MRANEEANRPSIHTGVKSEKENPVQMKRCAYTSTEQRLTLLMQNRLKLRPSVKTRIILVSCGKESIPSFYSEKYDLFQVFKRYKISMNNSTTINSTKLRPTEAAVSENLSKPSGF